MFLLHLDIGKLGHIIPVQTIKTFIILLYGFKIQLFPKTIV